MTPLALRIISQIQSLTGGAKTSPYIFPSPKGKGPIENVQAECQPERIILFGSYAYGNPEAESDLDILVIMERGESGPKKAAEILSRINPRIPVDLVVRTEDEIRSRLQDDDFFLAEIMNRGRVLYEAPNP